MALYTQGALSVGYTQDDLEAAPDEVRSATFEQALSDLPGWSLVRAERLAEARKFGGIAFRSYQPEEAEQYMAERGLAGQFTFDRQYNGDELRILADRKSKELKRSYILARAQGGVLAGAGRLGIQLATSFLDPLAIASAFVPVVGEARYGAMLAKASGALGRAGVRAGVGAVEGAVGAAVVEPIIYAAKSQEQADYALADSMLNIALGGVFGGGLHAVGGAVGDAIRAARSQAPQVVGRSEPPAIGDTPSKGFDLTAADQTSAQVRPVPVEFRESVVAAGRLPQSEKLFIPGVPPKEVMDAASRVEVVPLADVRGTQYQMGGDSPGALIDGYGDMPVAARMESGEFLIYDGHHRAVAAISRGDQGMQMHVVDAKRYAPESAGRKVRKPSADDDDALLRELADSPDAPAALKTAAASAQTREAALGVAMAQAQSGEPIEVRPLFDRNSWQDAQRRLSDPDQAEFSNPDAVTRADATLAEGDAVEAASLQQQVADMDARLADIEREAGLTGDEAATEFLAGVREQVAALEKEAKESSNHARMLAVCAMRHAV